MEGGIYAKAIHLHILFNFVQRFLFHKWYFEELLLYNLLHFRRSIKNGFY